MSQEMKDVPGGGKPAVRPARAGSIPLSGESRKTLAFVAAALLMTGVAIYGGVDRSGPPEAFNDQGKAFFARFEPAACTTLEVFDFDPGTLTPLPFKVTYKDKRWVIPSHADYPADPRQRLVDTATGVQDLIKDSIRSDRAEDQETFGVVDPLDPNASKFFKGFGKRVTLKDASEKVLADFIIGNEVKGHPDQRYVRVPGRNRIYGVNVKVDLSTRFADWIETNLLKLDGSRVRRVVVDHKSFDPETRQEVKGEKFTVERKDSSTPWTIADGVPEGKEPNTETLLAMTNALNDLKIAGVRLKPEGLTADLKEAPGEVKPTTRQALMSMVSKGFYPTRAGLLSSKGEVTVFTDEGVVYSLRFGEVIIAAGDQLSAGVEPPQGKAAKEAGKGKDPAKAGNEGTSEGRYLFVTASFDPALIPPAKPTPAEDAELPDDPFAYGPGEGKVLAPSQEARDKAKKLQDERDRQVAEGRKRAAELSDRFAPWYYVTPGDSYRTIVLDRPNLIRDKSARPAGPTPGPGGRSPFPGGFGGQPFNPH